MAAALHRERDIARLPELRRIMELGVDRAHTIGPHQPGRSMTHTTARANVVPREHGPRLTR
jgi:hypothetical protein